MTDAQLEAAMKEAVACGMLPKTMPHEEYICAWANMRAILDAALSIASQEATAPRGTSERTPQDYAIEHAGYLANSARYLIGCLNELDAATIAREERDDDASHDDYSSVAETAIEARTALRGAIYEFEKRRDRAILAEASQPAPSDDEIRKVWNATQDPVALVRAFVAGASPLPTASNGADHG